MSGVLDFLYLKNEVIPMPLIFVFLKFITFTFLPHFQILHFSD